jgi:hypothetical protein
MVTGRREEWRVKRWKKCDPDSFRRILAEAGICDYEIIDD